MLDEPNAALDAETEHALFERYAAAACAGGADERPRQTPGWPRSRSFSSCSMLHSSLPKPKSEASLTTVLVLQRPPFLVVRLDPRLLVVDVQRRGHPVGFDAGSAPYGGAVGDAPGEVRRLARDGVRRKRHVLRSSANFGSAKQAWMISNTLVSGSELWRPSSTVSC